MKLVLLVLVGALIFLAGRGAPVEQTQKELKEEENDE